MNSIYSLAIVTVIAVMTFVTRALPFAVFSRIKVPRPIEYLGKFLPYAVTTMLVVYCLKDVDFLSGSYGIPELVSIFATILIHLWKRNTILSIFSGTILYMVIVNFI
ncbi:MAG: branched-chain amino acid transporter AzlD [Clostridiales bacterium]|nr:branched-chain amino acid transporter AzlD [Clostridiales bacterium]